ncbi:MAG TPA: hypothetical protein VLZ89_14780 [Anaerolineales bacterium]|nr:hypothetical protein [Anaerolineales bacterium]
MHELPLKPKQPDTYSLEMIIVLAIITLHDFLLSNTLSIPAALGRIALARLISLDRVVSGLEFVVPVAIFAAMLVLWATERDRGVHNLAVIYLAWVTLRLVAKISLVSYIIASRPQNGVGVLLKDTVVLWIANVLLFGTWYWIIDAGGPRLRRAGPAQRVDFAFPQRAISLAGWQEWRPGFWDYVFLGFCGSTQFGLADTLVLSLRAKFLLMLQAALSVTVIVFIASIAIAAMR